MTQGAIDAQIEQLAQARTRKEVLKWRLRWFRKLPRRSLRRLDKVLAKFGLVRASQVPRIEIDRDGHIRVEFKNGFRWAGRHESDFLNKMMTPTNPSLTPEFCPGAQDPRCKSMCTINPLTNRIQDPDCFRSS